MIYVGHTQIRGIIPPLTTPFKRDGTLYEEGLRRLIDFQVDKGSLGVFLCGTYGSGPLMSVSQRKKVVDISADQIKNRISLLVHVGTTNTKDSVELAKHAEDYNADAIAAVPPYYYRHDSETVLRYYRDLVEAVDIPVYVYNNPKTSGFTVTPHILAKMANLGVKGIKDSGFSLVDFTHFLLEFARRENFSFIIGTEALAFPALMMGAKGCVSGLANAFPEPVVSLYNAIMPRIAPH